MKITLILSILFGLFISTSANEKEAKKEASVNTITMSVSGNVSDAKTGEALVGVKVQLEGTEKKAYTDFDGNYYFDEVSPGEYSVTASYISYEKNKVENKNIDVLTNTVDIKLQKVD
jgi:hypothetical protein